MNEKEKDWKEKFESLEKRLEKILQYHLNLKKKLKSGLKNILMLLV